MIVAAVQDWHLYGLGPLWQKAFTFLQGDMAALPDGRIDVAGDDLFANVATYVPGAGGPGRYEAHREYMDIQFIVRGTEYLGYAPLGELEPLAPYDAGKDVQFLRCPDGVATQVLLQPGMFAALLAQDGHMPAIAVQVPSVEVRKVVMKVRLSALTLC